LEQSREKPGLETAAPAGFYRPARRSFSRLLAGSLSTNTSAPQPVRSYRATTQATVLPAIRAAATDAQTSTRYSSGTNQISLSYRAESRHLWIKQPQVARLLQSGLLLLTTSRCPKLSLRTSRT